MPEETVSPPRSWSANIDASGRVLIPAELRNMLEVEPGDSLTWIKDEDGLHLKSFAETLKKIQAYYCSLAPPEDVWSEELIKERRMEAAREASDE